MGCGPSSPAHAVGDGDTKGLLADPSTMNSNMQTDPIAKAPTKKKSSSSGTKKSSSSGPKKSSNNKQAPPPAPPSSQGFPDASTPINRAKDRTDAIDKPRQIQVCDVKRGCERKEERCVTQQREREREREGIIVVSYILSLLEFTVFLLF
jgi:hypothetical protein